MHRKDDAQSDVFCAPGSSNCLVVVVVVGHLGFHKVSERTRKLGEGAKKFVVSLPYYKNTVYYF